MVERTDGTEGSNWAGIGHGMTGMAEELLVIQLRWVEYLGIGGSVESATVEYLAERNLAGVGYFFLLTRAGQ